MNNVIEEEYNKITPTLVEALNDLKQLDEGILDYVKKGFKSLKDATMNVTKKIRDVFTKFLKAVLNRFTEAAKKLFQKNPNEGLEFLGIDLDVSGIKVFK